jgi:hypothetical protein
MKLICCSRAMRRALLIAPLVSAPVDAQEEIEPPPQVGYHVLQVSPHAGGVYAYVPGQWGVLHLQLSNPDTDPVEVLCATYFEDETTLQYGRRVWLPGRSRLMTWHPIRLPALTDPQANQVRYRTLAMSAGESDTGLIRGDGGKMLLDSRLGVVPRGQVTGLIDRPPRPEDQSPVFTPFDLVTTARVEQLPSRRVSPLGDRIIPGGEEALSAYDQIVLADDRLLADQTGLSALRGWLCGGGRLWVLLDRIDPRLLEMLLGDECGWQTVDRVGLTRVRIESGPASPASPAWEAEYEQPVDLVRLLVDDVDVLYHVGGWPAAFEKACGQGRLLVTTMGIPGWIRQRRPGDPRPQAAPSEATNYSPTPALRELAARFFRSRPAPLVPAAALEQHARESVGYSIPPRWLVVGILAGLAALLAAVGACLSRAGRLERLGLVAPVLAAAATGGLLLAGQSRRESVRPTAALVQLVQPIAGTDDARVSGAVGLYAADSGTAILAGTRGGWLLPDMSGAAGTTRRLMCTDIGQWRWENLPQSQGLRGGEFFRTGLSDVRVDAVATFGPRGVTGRLNMPRELRPADGVLTTQTGRIGVTTQDDGTLAADADRVFTAEQYLGAGLLSDEQNRRVRTLQALTVPSDSGDPGRATLMFWTAPWDLGFQFESGADVRGSALVAAPLNWERPPPDTEVTIPAPLLAYREVEGPDGLKPSGLYDYRRLQWNQRSWPSASWLEFRVPEVLFPATLTAARIGVRVAGPVGKLALASASRGTIVPVETWTDPVGTLTLDIRDPALLALDAQGRLLLRVSGGDPDRPELTTRLEDGSEHVSYWRIESLQLELKAKVLD